MATLPAPFAVSAVPPAGGGTVPRDDWSSRKQRVSPFQRVALELSCGTPHLPF